MPAPVSFTQTVNVGGNSAISRVTVTGQDVSDAVVTAMSVSLLPSGVPHTASPVYQHIEIIPARCTAISTAVIEFEVPLSLIEEQNITIDDIVLSRFYDGIWTDLPTTYIRSDNGHVIYRAQSPGFSLVAIVMAQDRLKGLPVIPTPAEPEFVEPVHAAHTSTANPIATQTTAPPPVQHVLPDTGIPSTTIILVLLACAGISGGAVLAHRWWMRKKNPDLFRKFD